MKLGLILLTLFAIVDRAWATTPPPPRHHAANTP